MVRLCEIFLYFPSAPRSYAAIAAHPDCNPLLPDNDGKSDDPEMAQGQWESNAVGLKPRNGISPCVIALRSALEYAADRGLEAAAPQRNVGKVHKTSRRKGAEEYIIIEIVENQISMLDLIEGDSGSPLNFMATPQLHGVKVCQGDKCCESWSGKTLALNISA